MPEYREKLWAAPWVFVATALVVPASILVLAPISLLAGIVTAIGLYGGCVLLLTLGSPTVRVSVWLVSSRRPHEPAAAINRSRRPVTED